MVGHEDNSDLQVFVKGGDSEDIGQALVLRNEEEGSTMKEVVEEKSFGSTRRCFYLSKDLV